MSKIVIMCADGVEEVECLTVVDFCRRADIDVIMASVTGRRQVNGSHRIRFVADTVLEELDAKDLDGIVLPGGAGYTMLEESTEVKELCRQFFTEGRLVAAICAAPSVLAGIGILKGKKATAYPGFQAKGAALWTENTVERDGNVITGRGPGAAPYFALEIIRCLKGDAAREEIAASTMMP